MFTLWKSMKHHLQILPTVWIYLSSRQPQLNLTTSFNKFQSQDVVCQHLWSWLLHLLPQDVPLSYLHHCPGGLCYLQWCLISLIFFLFYCRVDEVYPRINEIFPLNQGCVALAAFSMSIFSMMSSPQAVPATISSTTCGERADTSLDSSALDPRTVMSMIYELSSLNSSHCLDISSQSPATVQPDSKFQSQDVDWQHLWSWLLHLLPQHDLLSYLHHCPGGLWY